MQHPRGKTNSLTTGITPENCCPAPPTSFKWWTKENSMTTNDDDDDDTFFQNTSPLHSLTQSNDRIKNGTSFPPLFGKPPFPKFPTGIHFNPNATPQTKNELFDNRNHTRKLSPTALFKSRTKENLTTTRTTRMMIHSSKTPRDEQ
ncbi:hypothetical protein CEXT_718971 [Caerostris extrusa]|uniref:Uncharacterized protein n=1 Tax=Caerostris extrusa TaxID=172846 RepID=A0AAV4V3V8_CAEEX|nr:hypothetical protein CEXT_718971 [Caerostris extrusa]